MKKRSLFVIKPDKIENIVINIARIIIISFSGSCYNNNFFNLANLCYYVCLTILISISKYVRKRKKHNNNIKGDKTGVIFWSTVYLSRSGLKGDLQSLYRPEIVT